MYDQLVSFQKGTTDKTDMTLLAFLSVWTMSTVSIGRLTWWEFSWDIMEPVAWAVQAGGFLFWGWYYFITRNENSMSDLQNRIQNKNLVKKLQKNNFDTNKYNQLIQRRKEVDDQLMKFRRWWFDRLMIELQFTSVFFIYSFAWSSKLYIINKKSLKIYPNKVSIWEPPPLKFIVRKLFNLFFTV